MKTKTKYTYRIEANILGRGWQVLFGAQDGSLEYMRGRFAGFREGSSPCPAFRLVRVDPEDPSALKILDETRERTELSMGLMPQAFGSQWPTYASAAARALEYASKDAGVAFRRGDKPTHISDRLMALSKAVRSLVEDTPMDAAIEVLASVLADGTRAYRTPPQSVTKDAENNYVLIWKTDRAQNEIRIRGDGKINWYSLGQGNEGWSTYSLGSRFGDPWKGTDT